MRARGSWLLLCLCVWLQASALAAQGGPLQIGGVAVDSLMPGATHRYQLTAPGLTLLSLHLAALDDELDPVLRVVDSGGGLIADNDDYDYPRSRDAVIQALLLPKFDNYVIEVSAFGEGGGSYRLDVLPGFDKLALRDDALAEQGWESVHGDANASQPGAGRLAFEIQGLAHSAMLLGKRFPHEADAYFELAFSDIFTVNGGQVGIVFRYLDPDNYSRLLLNQRGFWRIDRVMGGIRSEIRDWTTHPAIVAEADAFRLGLLLSGDHLDVVYAGQVVGSVVDPGGGQAGGFGIAMRTANAIGSRLSFSVSEALMTLPTRVDGGLIFPSQLRARNSRLMTDAMARHQLIPAGGQIKLTLPESTVRHRQAGVTRYLLGAGITFADLAMAARLRYDLYDPGNGGCGLVFHHQDDAHYTLAYVTAEGEFGVSRRDGDAFAAGIYGQMPAAEPKPRQLLLTAQEEILHFYIDGEHVGSMPYAGVAGRIGIAVVNYEPVDIDCRIEDLWVLSLDAAD